MINKRKCYVSESRSYNLDPTKVFDVVSDLIQYTTCAVFQAIRDNSARDVRPVASLSGHGTKLVLLTEVVNEPGFFTSFDLAELVLSAKKDKLTLEVHAHPNVAIPPGDLYYIGNKHKR